MRPHALLALTLLSSAAWAGGLKGPVKLVNKDGTERGALKDGVAILEPLEAGKVKVGKRPLLKFKTVGKKFVPRVGITTPGSDVAFPNLDSIIHNVFSVTRGNAFDTGAYNSGDSPKATIRNPGLVKLYCNVHHKMNAFLWVVETPYAQVLDGTKGVEFEEVPPGKYRLRLWHPEVGEKTFPVTVGEGVTMGNWTLSAELPAFEVHKNKFGKDYPPAADDGSY